MNANSFGPFSQLLEYKPGTPGSGVFPPTGVWWRDMCRVLFGLEGPIGDKMREADLSVYDGIPFAENSGRKKIRAQKTKAEYYVVANYWRDRIREETKSSMRKKSKQLKFVFNQNEVDYFNKHCSD